MGHHSQHSPIPGSQARDAAGTAVRIRGICFRGFQVVVDIADRDQVGIEEGLSCCRLRGRVFEMSAALAVTEGDGHGSTFHPMQEDRRGFRIVEDLYHGKSSLVLFRYISFEIGPGFGSGDERFETSEELASVADAEGEGIFSREEIHELLP